MKEFREKGRGKAAREKKRGEERRGERIKLQNVPKFKKIEVFKYNQI